MADLDSWTTSEDEFDGTDEALGRRSSSTSSDDSNTKEIESVDVTYKPTSGGCGDWGDAWGTKVTTTNYTDGTSETQEE